MFSADDRYLLTGSFDRKLHLVEVATGRELWNREHNSYIRSLAFSADTRKIVIGDEDGTVRIRDRETGAELARTVLDGPVRAVCFSGSRFLTVSGERQVQVKQHILEPTDLAHELCGRVTRGLDREEWIQYVGDEVTFEPVCAVAGAKKSGSRKRQ